MSKEVSESQGKVISHPNREKQGRPNYKNWVPKGMLIAMAVVDAALLVLAIVFFVSLSGTLRTVLTAVCCVALVALLIWTIKYKQLYNAFSYDGKRQLSRQIIEGTAAYVTLPEGGTGLDIGCGSGALTIACAKRNPQGKMVGLDRWGADYASFTNLLCVRNAQAEGITNIDFKQGNATELPFGDETFDAVTSNYCYHNIAGKNKQALLLETLRVLKKGGTFAIHDLMSRRRYGDMESFCNELRGMGYERVEMIDTTDGMFMSKAESRRFMLAGSTLLVGRK